MKCWSLGMGCLDVTHLSDLVQFGNVYCNIDSFLNYVNEVHQDYNMQNVIESNPITKEWLLSIKDWEFVCFNNDEAIWVVCHNIIGAD